MNKFKNTIIAFLIGGLLVAACGPTAAVDPGVATEMATMSQAVATDVAEGSQVVAEAAIAAAATQTSPDAAAEAAVQAAGSYVENFEPNIAAAVPWLYLVYTPLPEGVTEVMLEAMAIGGILPPLFRGTGGCESAAKLADHLAADGGRRLASRFGDWDGLARWAARLERATVKAVATSPTGKKIALWASEGGDEFIIVAGGGYTGAPTAIPLTTAAGETIEAAAARLLANTSGNGNSPILLAANEEVKTLLVGAGTKVSGLLTEAQLAQASLELAAFARCLKDESNRRGGSGGAAAGQPSLIFTSEDAVDAAAVLVAVGVTIWTAKLAASALTGSPVPLLVPVGP